MAYATKTEVRDRIACDEFKPSDTVLDDFISKAEIDLKNQLGGSLNRKILTSYEENSTFTIDVPGAKSINEIKVDTAIIDEFSTEELLTNPNVESTENDEVQGWNESQGTGDTLSQDSDNSWIYSHSLKIAKGAAVNSYFYSDTSSFDDETYYRGKAKLYVDSNTAANTSLKLEFLDSDSSIVKTYTSETLSVEITQPTSASVIAIVSDNAKDIYQAIILTGRLVSGGEVITESVELNGTTSVNSDNSFVEIISIEKSEETAGTVTLTSNSAGVTNGTMAATTNILEKWQEVQVIGSPTEDSASMRVSFYVSSSATSGSAYADNFQLRKCNWFLRQGKVYFAESVQGNIIIDYEKAQVSRAVREIVRDLASLYSLIHYAGADSSGTNYASLKSSQFPNTGLQVLYTKILDNLQRNMDIYVSVEDIDFLIGELV